MAVAASMCTAAYCIFRDGWTTAIPLESTSDVGMPSAVRNV